MLKAKPAPSSHDDSFSLLVLGEMAIRLPPVCEEVSLAHRSPWQLGLWAFYSSISKAENTGAG